MVALGGLSVGGAWNECHHIHLHHRQLAVMRRVAGARRHCGVSAVAGEDSFSQPSEFEGTPDESGPLGFNDLGLPPAEADDGSWIDDGAWTGSWAGEEDPEAPAADWLSAAAPAPIQRSRPIETIKVGRVSGPFKRRNGYHVEVAVQHTDREESLHRLWFGHQVVAEVARLRGFAEHNIDVERFGEAVLSFLQQRGVDLGDPDWGMQDDAIPFSVDFLPVRTLFDCYPEMPAALADACLSGSAGDADPGEEEVARDIDDSELDVPFVFDRPFIELDKDAPLRSSREELQAAVDKYDAARNA